MHIRSAKEADISLLVDIGKQTFYDTFATVNDPEDMARYLEKSFDPAQIQLELNDPNVTYLIAESAEGVAGYLKLKEGDIPECITGDAPIELVRLYVDASRIGKGYGAALMKQAIQEAAVRGFQTIWLGVWEDNDRAIRFYEKWGFKTSGSHTFMLGEDAQTDLIMERSTTT